jgi:hypothetical protein
VAATERRRSSGECRGGLVRLRKWARILSVTSRQVFGTNSEFASLSAEERMQALEGLVDAGTRTRIRPIPS